MAGSADHGRAPGFGREEGFGLSTQGAAGGGAARGQLTPARARLRSPSPGRVSEGAPGLQTGCFQVKRH